MGNQPESLGLRLHLLCDIEHDHPSCPLALYSISQQDKCPCSAAWYSHLQITILPAL